MYCCSFDANAGLFEQILGPEDAVISDTLNHASIIDGKTDTGDISSIKLITNLMLTCHRNSFV